MCTSLKKDRLYSEYAEGKITMDELVAGIEALKPDDSRAKRVDLIVRLIIVAILLGLIYLIN